MKTFVAAGLIGLDLILATSAAQEPKKDAPKDAPKVAPASADLKDAKQKAGYAMGLNVGHNIMAQAAELDIDPDAMLKAIKDVLTGATPAMTQAQCEESINDLRKKVMAKREAKMSELKAGAAENKKRGETYLAANKDKDGVKITKSGLQYKVLKEGTGKAPKSTDTVRVHYKGTLIDGTKFDSSYDRNEPTEFPVDGVIRGWIEGLQLMKEGSKYQFFIPSDLAYGPKGSPPMIGPDSVLVFEVELLKVL